MKDTNERNQQQQTNKAKTPLTYDTTNEQTMHERFDVVLHTCMAVKNNTFNDEGDDNIGSSFAVRVKRRADKKKRKKK